jgi:hypothetical protein
MRFILLLLVGIFLCHSSIQSQSFKSDTAFLATSVLHAKEIYSKAVFGQQRLLNGSEYLEYQPTGQEHPYFLFNEWLEGSIEYDGQVFNNVLLRYNLYTDEIITQHTLTYRTIQLVKDKIARFTLDGHSFVALNSKALPTGFYDCLWAGDASLYAKRTKELKETISSGKVVREFNQKSRYFVSKDGLFYPINGKKALVKILNDRSIDFNSFIRSARLSFRKNKIEASLVKIVEFYSNQK